MESRGRGVLDTPHARGMTTVAEERSDEAIPPFMRGNLDCFVALLLAMTRPHGHRSEKFQTGRNLFLKPLPQPAVARPDGDAV